jgi:hypothetical protein
MAALKTGEERTPKLTINEAWSGSRGTERLANLLTYLQEQGKPPQSSNGW